MNVTWRGLVGGDPARMSADGRSKACHGNVERSDSDMTVKNIIRRHGMKYMALIMVSVGASQGCSSVGAGDGGEGGPEEVWPPGWESNGLVVKCELAAEPGPTTGDPAPDLVTCVAKESIEYQFDPNCNNNKLRDTYLRVICAQTFGGAPDDYLSKGGHDWYSSLDDYPNETFEDYGSCDVNYPFGPVDEIPASSDAILLSTGQYNRCSRDSYCATLNKIIEVYPLEGLEPDPWCNVSPGGDSEAPGPWRCMESSDGACGYAYLEANLPDPTTICPIVEPDGKEYCVIAVSENDASNKCQDVCGVADLAYLEDYGNVVYPNAGQLNCTVFGSATMLWASDVVAQCHNIDYEIDGGNVVPFSFGADLLIDGGANASVSDDESLGFMAYRVENCVGLVCDIVIEGLELSYLMHTGTYYSDERAPFPFSVDGVSIALLEPVRGTITSSSSGPAVVAFPSEIFVMRLYTGDVELDGVSLGAVGPLDMAIDQVTGSYSGGVLALDIAYDTLDATMLLTLTTF